MSRVIVLDSGPVGLASKAPGHPDGAICRAWIKARRRAGEVVAVPEIARYEVRRELFRSRAIGGLGRLDQLHPGCAFLPITSTIIDIASELWAHVRNSGLGTASDDALDGDAILAAQALSASDDGHDVVIATTNVAHLSRFPGVIAVEWHAIA